jgi:hypothetical protein
MMEQDAAPAGVPRKHALGRPREMPSAGTKTGRLKWLDGRGDKGGDELPGSEGDKTPSFRLSPEVRSHGDRKRRQMSPSGASYLGGAPRGAPRSLNQSAARINDGCALYGAPFPQFT